MKAAAGWGGPGADAAAGRGAAASRGSDGLRQEVTRRDQGARVLWAVVLLGCLLLVSIFSGGLFLYAVVVVVGVYISAEVWARSSLEGLTIWRHLSSTEVELGDVVDVRIVVQNGKKVASRWLLMADPCEKGLDIEGPRAAQLSLEPGAKTKLVYRLHTLRRGFFRVGPLVLEAGDPIGLVQRFRVDPQASFLTVLPRVVPLGQGWPLGHRPIHEVPRRQGLFEDPSRFLGIRDYRPGDSLRRVHWRATARTGKLQVKLYEPAVLDGLLLAVDMGESRFAAFRPKKDDDATLGAVDPLQELVVSVVASLGAWVLQGGQSVALLANGSDAAESYPDDWQGGSFRRRSDVLHEAAKRQPSKASAPIELVAGKGERQLGRLQTLLARLVPARGPALSRILQEELPRLPRSHVVMIVTPSLDLAWVQSLATLHRAGFELGVIWVGSGAGAGSSETAGVGQSGEGSDQVEFLPSSIPVYRVGSLADLESLGGQRL